MTVFTAVAAVFAAVPSAIAAVTSAFTAVSAENTDETAVTNTASTSVKVSQYRSNVSFSVYSTNKEVNSENIRQLESIVVNKETDYF